MLSCYPVTTATEKGPLNLPSPYHPATSPTLYQRGYIKEVKSVCGNIFISRSNSPEQFHC